MKLITALLVRNEAGPERYLRRVLATCQKWSDNIVVLDDGSTDDTPKVCADFGALVKTREHSPQAWGNEASARQELWELAMTQVEDVNSWILIADADMEFVGNPRELCLAKDCNSWATVLYDMWSETEYREDEYWVGHRTPRIWLVNPARVPAGWTPQWNPRGVHCGHLPANWPAFVNIAPPDKYYYLHRAYQNPIHRKAKYEQYKSTFHLMSDHERRHAESIIQ